MHDDHGPITGRFDPWRMPEGPSRVILREETEAFVGRKILRVSGNSKQNIARLDQQNVLARRRWGKHVLIECAHFSVRIHFLLFGSYRTNEDKPNAVPRLCLEFSNGQRLNFYACSVQFIERTLDDVYDWTAHAMNPLWDAAQARRKRRAVPGMLVADALLDQALFAGVGNIIKNEVSHRIRVHPEEHGRCVACTQTRRTGVPGARRQFRFSSLEKKPSCRRSITRRTPRPTARAMAHRCSIASTWARRGAVRLSPRCASGCTAPKMLDVCGGALEQ